LALNETTGDERLETVANLKGATLSPKPFDRAFNPIG
jgi:hypothetical protein